MTLSKAVFLTGASAVTLAVVAAITLSPIIGAIAALVAAVAFLLQHRENTKKEAVQRERAMKAERELLELRQKVQWRRLTSGERTALRDALTTASAKGLVTLYRRDSRDEEAEEYSGEIASVLTESGWRYQELIGADNLIPRDPVGLSIRVTDPHNPPPHASVLKAALDSTLGLNVPIAKGSGRSSNEENSVALLVHPKRL